MVNQNKTKRMAMYTMAKTLKATVVGPVKWAKINNKVDIYTVNGQTKRTYQIYQDMTGKEAETFKAEINATFKEFKESPECKDKKFDERFPASLGYTEENGVTTFKFWTYSEYKATETQPETQKIVPVFVVGKGPIGEKNIGNGSKAQIAYTLSPYYSSAKGFGVSLILEKVLVHDLVEFGGASEDMSVFGVDLSGSGNVFSDATSGSIPIIPEEEIPF